MKTRWNWQTLVNASFLNRLIGKVEIAKVIKVPVNKIMGWREYKGRLLVSISGRGGRFVGYWQFEATIKRLVKAMGEIVDEETWKTVREGMQQGLKRYRHSAGAQVAIEHAIERRDGYFARKRLCRRWADGFIETIQRCFDRKSLGAVSQSFKEQRRFFEREFPEEVERVVVAKREQWAGLRHAIVI